MKELRILTFFLAIAFLGANSSFAQSKAAQLTDEQKEELAQNMEKYFDALNLSAEQKSDFESITKKYAKQMLAVRDGSGGKYRKYKKIKSMQKDKNSEMKKLLSKEQYQTYLKVQEEMQKKMKEKRA